MTSDLQDLCFSAKALGLRSLVDFFNKTLQPPSQLGIRCAIHQLQDLQVLDEFESITSLGALVKGLPLSPSIGKMVVLGMVFRCLDPLVTLAAFLSVRDPFNPHADTSKVLEAKRLFLGEGAPMSDHLLLLAVFRKWLKVRASAASLEEERAFCANHCLLSPALEQVLLAKEQIANALLRLGLLEREEIELDLTGGPQLNYNAENPSLLKALLSSGLYPNIAEHTGKKTYRTRTEAVVVCARIFLSCFFCFSAPASKLFCDNRVPIPLLLLGKMTAKRRTTPASSCTQNKPR